MYIDLTVSFFWKRFRTIVFLPLGIFYERLKVHKVIVMIQHSNTLAHCAFHIGHLGYLWTRDTGCKVRAHFFLPNVFSWHPLLTMLTHHFVITSSPEKQTTASKRLIQIAWINWKINGNICYSTALAFLIFHRKGLCFMFNSFQCQSIMQPILISVFSCPTHFLLIQAGDTLWFSFSVLPLRPAQSANENSAVIIFCNLLLLN